MDYVKARGSEVMVKSKAAFEVAISQNPEKIRTILNFLFVPDFKPTFEDDGENDDLLRAASAGPDNLSLRAAPNLPAIADPGGLQNRFPYRMIDLRTKELVVRPEIGTLGQYCILSHSWKFPEVTYRDFTAARSNTLIKTREGGKVVNVTRLSDVETTKRACWSRLMEQEKEVIRLVYESDALSKLGIFDDDALIGELLRRLKDVREAERGVNGRGGEDKAKKALADVIAAEHERKTETSDLKDLLIDIGLDDENIRIVLDEGAGLSGSEQTETEIDKAKRVLEEHRAAKARQTDNIKFFDQYRHIRNALDELVSRVTLCRSMTKIEQSIERCREVFDRNCFPETQNRYVWVDTCCIDKDDYSEYVRSISAMGDWYRNAEFCLVHLDTAKDFAHEWLQDWEIFSPKARKWSKDWDKCNLDGIRLAQNMLSYNDIGNYKPQWSTRAWTLQELVMSKTTFFVNSAWEFLSRPIEKLGYWYYLCPFVSLYSDLDTKNPFRSLLGDDARVEELAKVLDSELADTDRAHLEPLNTTVGKAQRLIAMLDKIDFRIRSDIDLYTARPWVTQAVNVTASSLSASGASLLAKVLYVLEPNTPGLHREYFAPDPETIKNVIGIILKCIVLLIQGPIIKDRQYIANFGNVRDLGTSWEHGFLRSNFSTSKSMALMRPREATEEIDRAYGLMGMLGVRFPTFQAEGLTKALSRLLDEVVIMSNDVSVFNWTGKQYGSPLRGRSLYPSVPEAYVPSQEETRTKGFEKRLAGILQIKRYECLNDFEQIQGMLLGVLAFIKVRRVSDDWLSWIREILKAMKRRDFKYLRPHIKNLGKIIRYIEIGIEKITASNTEKGQDEKKPDGGEQEAGGNSYFTSPLTSLSTTFNSFSSHARTPSFPTDTKSFISSKFSSKNSGAETAASPGMFGGGIGGFKKPSIMGFGRKNSGNCSPADTPKKEHVRAASNSPAPTDARDEARRLEEEKAKAINDRVLSYVQSIDDVDHGTSEHVSKLPDELEAVFASIPERKSTKPTTEPDNVETMVSPNPILVKSSGIEGVFDIQRVIVTIPQSAKLRREIKDAISPTQMINGWCSISTGFAMVFVGFSCPKHILEKELDVVDTVEAKILNRHEHDDDDDDDEAGESGDVEEDDDETASLKSPTGGPKKPELKRRGTSMLQRRLAAEEKKKKKQAENNMRKTSIRDLDDGDEDEDELMSAETKKEGKRVSRMIGFVQEPSLSLVAGEWVLARFSGVPGARWFLCYLDMGSSGRDLYGHRVATDEINFRNASPELGLMKYWESYIMRKKYLLCSMIQKLVESQDQASRKVNAPHFLDTYHRGKASHIDEARHDLTTMITGKANQGIAIASNFAGLNNTTQPPNPHPQDDLTSPSPNSPPNDPNPLANNEETLSTTLKELTSLALHAAGAGVAQAYYAKRAARLEQSLNADVLRTFPAHLQAALQSLDDNRDLMPSMFHSAKRVHMF